MGDFFSYFLNDVGIYYKGVIATNLSLFTTVPRNFLVVLIFFANLALVNRKLLGMLLTKCISKKSVSRFILLKVFFFLFCRFVSLASILWLPKGGYSNVFVFILTDFLMISSKISSFWSQVCNFTQIERLRPF